MSRRLFYVGAAEPVRSCVAEALGAKPSAGPVEELRTGDVVVVEAFADLAARSDVAGRNAFSACSAWKRTPGVAVYIVVRDDDPVGVQLARFVLADGVLRLSVTGEVEGLEQLQPGDRARPKRLVDALLERFGDAFSDAERSSQALERILHWEGDDTFLQRLQDEETGLLDGRYAALKLDEEFKRARRFHLPLSLILLDIGEAAAELPEGPERRALLAEVAGVFLNECRDIDVLGRFTPTVFLFLLPGTPPAGAEALTRRMLQALRERDFMPGLQAVAGVVAVPAPGIEDRKDFLVVAEACLERARRGRGDGGVVTAWE